MLQNIAGSALGQLVQKLTIGIFVISTVYIISVVVYRLFFHPLASYPGPFLAKITNLRGGYYAWTGDLHIDMALCHEKYGNYVRYAPNRLLVNTDTGLKEIYAFTKDVRKSPVYNAMVHRAPNTLTLIDKKAHGRKRRIISQGFSDAALRSHEPAIMRHVNRMCGQFVKAISSEGGWSSSQDMAKWSNYLTFDIMTDVIFGEEYDLIENEKFRYVVEAIEASNVRTSVLIQAAELAFRRWDKVLFKDAILGRNKFISFVSKLVKQRMESKPIQRKDVFSFLLSAKDPETQQGLGLAEIGAESTTMIVAGSDTSSTAIASVFFYLTRYPQAYAKVVEEVRKAFPSPDDVTLGPTLNSCTYLRACIDEALRLSPPASSSLWREVCNPAVTLDGLALPQGTEVGVCIHAIHHNEAYFPDSYAFKPERWLDDNEATSEANGMNAASKTKTASEAPQSVRAAFNPFSIGPRSCIGKGLANVELLLTLATVIAQFDFKAAEGAEGKVGEGRIGMGRGRERENEYQLFDHVTAAKKGPMILFKERDGATKSG